jgi:hypothetical protein
MQLKAEIENQLKQIAEEEAGLRGEEWTRGCPVTIKQENAGLRLLTDSEAAEYNATQSENARRKLWRAFRRTQNVDESRLTDIERQRYYRSLEIQGKYVQALRRVRLEMRGVPVVRQTPGLVASS